MFDSRVVAWIEGLRNASLTNVMEAVGLLTTSLALQLMWWATLLVLLVWRRWRHLFVWIGAILVLSFVSELASELIQRPRPMGVEILGPWRGFAMPSRPMAVLAGVLVSGLYSLLPVGRIRQIGKVVVAVVLVLTGFSRVYLAQDALTDVLLGVVLGVAIPLAAFRLLAPNEAFPVTYHRGRSAHLDIEGPRHEAIVQALTDQLGVIPIEVKPFGLEGSGGSTPCGSKSRATPTHLCSASSTRPHTCAPTGGTSSAAR